MNSPTHALRHRVQRVFFKCNTLFVLLKVTSATKTATSENVSFKARVNFFLFRRKVMFRSQDIQAFVFSTMP